MKIGPVLILSVMLLGSAQAADRTDPPEGVTAALNLYERGLKAGDLASLRSAFDADGVFVQSAALAVKATRFADVLPGWARDGDPKARFRLLSFAKPNAEMASVTGQLRMSDGCYHDQLLLLRRAGRWSIVAKTTVFSEQCGGGVGATPE